jgi:hypothetical protein
MISFRPAQTRRQPATQPDEDVGGVLPLRGWSLSKERAECGAAEPHLLASWDGNLNYRIEEEEKKASRDFLLNK